jgi:hypothetical protein
LGLIEEVESASLCFASLEFATTFLRHFRSNLRDLIFQKLRNYLAQQNAQLMGISQFSLTMLQRALFHGSEFHSLAIDLLVILGELMNHNRDLIAELSTITPALLTFFLEFPTDALWKRTSDFVLFVAFNCVGFEFCHSDMLSLGRAVRSMEKDGYQRPFKYFWFL